MSKPPSNHGYPISGHLINSIILFALPTLALIGGNAWVLNVISCKAADSVGHLISRPGTGNILFACSAIAVVMAMFSLNFDPFNQSERLVDTAACT